METIDVEVMVVKTTDAALLVQVDGHEDPVWIPKSQIDDTSEIDDQADPEDIGTLTIPEWLAREKGLTE